MESTRSLDNLRVGIDGCPSEVHPPSVTKRRQVGKTPAHATTRLSDPEARADAIGRAAPFSAWPRDVLLRLAAAASVSSHRSGTTLIVGGQRCDKITVVADGTVISSVSSPGGRRVVFKFDDSSYAYGLFSLVDGLPQGHDLVADGPVTVIRIPHAAIRGELERMPSLWESIAVEVTRRGSRHEPADATVRVRRPAGARRFALAGPAGQERQGRRARPGGHRTSPAPGAPGGTAGHVAGNGPRRWCANCPRPASSSGAMAASRCWMCRRCAPWPPGASMPWAAQRAPISGVSIGIAGCQRCTAAGRRSAAPNDKFLLVLEPGRRMILAASAATGQSAAMTFDPCDLSLHRCVPC